MKTQNNEPKKDSEKEFILLRGPIGNKFFTTNKEKSKEEIVKDINGNIVFDIIGYADSVEEAQIKLYGRTFPL